MPPGWLRPQIRSWGHALVSAAAPVARRWGGRLLDLAFPPHCARCHVPLPEGEASRVLLCRDCSALLVPQLKPHCRKCGSLTVAGDVATCLWCRRWRLHFDGVIPLGEYGGQLRQTVLRMKRPAGEQMALTVGSLLAARRREELQALAVDRIAALPMHWIRRCVRGTNSAELLAESLAKALGVRVAARVLRRCRNTKHQPGLPPRERFANVRGAFAVRVGYDLQGQRILLVDDVLTTGASCSAAAEALKRAGAAAVFVAVVARADGPDAR